MWSLADRCKYWDSSCHALRFTSHHGTHDFGGDLGWNVQHPRNTASWLWGRSGWKREIKKSARDECQRPIHTLSSRFCLRSTSAARERGAPRRSRSCKLSRSFWRWITLVCSSWDMRSRPDTFCTHKHTQKDWKSTTRRKYKGFWVSKVINLWMNLLTKGKHVCFFMFEKS